MASLKRPHNQSFVDAVTSQQSFSADLVQEFIAPINATLNVSEKAFDDSIWSAWQDVTSLARQIPHDKQEKLVDFVDELTKQPVAVTEREWNEDPLTEKGGWKALPMLGMEMRECWNTSPQGKDESDEGWVNLNAFAARLTASASTEGESRDFSLFAIWTMREALEDSDLSGKEDLPNSSVLQAAAMWMIYARKTLKERSEKNQTFDGKMAKEGKSLEGKEWRGFSAARWQVWVERLRLAKDRCQDERTKELLGKAISE